MDISTIVIKPIITEKSMKDVGTSVFTFQVKKNADKPLIKRAIENVFKVDVVSVRTSILKGRGKRVGQRRIEVKQSPFKKAFVELKKGQKIDLFDIAEEKK